MNLRTMGIAGLLVLAVVVIVGASALLAQEPAAAPEGDGAEAPAAGGGQNLFDIFVLGGGLIGFVIIALSIASLALAIESFVNIKRDKLAPPAILVELETLLEEEQYEEAITLCESSRNYLTICLGAALAKLGEGHEKMVEAATTAMDEENLKLNQKIAYQNLLGAIAPMMGLFGTVQGMIGAFMIIEQTGTPSPAQLAKGIYVALVTTFQGLFVALPALTFFFFLKNRVSKLSFELGTVVLEFVDRFKAVASEAPAQK